MRTEPHAFHLRDLRGGRLALDFVNTVTARDSAARDWLSDHASLLDWAGLTGQVDSKALAHLRRLAARDPGAAAAALERCKRLRETLYTILSALVRRGPVPTSALRGLDTMRTAAATRARLGTTNEGVAATPSLALAGLDYVADLVLHDALDLLARLPRDRLRVCAGEDCGWLFHDTSKAGRRRWCDMATCGQAHKGRRPHGAAAGALLAWTVFGAAWGGADADAAEPVRWTPSALSSPAYESSPAFTPDGRELYFMRADPAFARYTLLRTRCGPRGWSRPQAAPFALPGRADDGDPFVTRDGRRLYFISTRKARGKEGQDFDIWYVERRPGARWSEPVRLPAPVNSPHAELMPRVLEDGRLYFGSDRPGGIGGNDVYVATPLSGGGWRVDNLGPDVNSSANDFEVEVDREARNLVLVSDRAGRSHLFRFRKGADGRWQLLGQVAARADVFQVGPLLSPRGDRLLFAQADGVRSGELFLADLEAQAERAWPPSCPAAPRR